jgi:hypothetical protein
MENMVTEYVSSLHRFQIPATALGNVTLPVKHDMCYATVIFGEMT